MREPAADWSALYLEARSREGRLLPDATVAALPELPRGHPLADEWRQRADSAARLVAYVRRRPRPMTIVDLGCGNGWLADRLATVDGSSVVGVDVNAVELEQARRVFGGRPGLALRRSATSPTAPSWSTGPTSSSWPASSSTCPIRAPSSPPSPPGSGRAVRSTSSTARSTSRRRWPRRRQRTERHYAGLGVPEMAARYFHHDWRIFDPPRRGGAVPARPPLAARRAAGAAPRSLAVPVDPHPQRCPTMNAGEPAPAS